MYPRKLVKHCVDRQNVFGHKAVVLPVHNLDIGATFWEHAYVQTNMLCMTPKQASGILKYYFQSEEASLVTKGVVLACGNVRSPVIFSEHLKTCWDLPAL